MKRNDSAGGEQANDDILLAQTQPCISIPHAIAYTPRPTLLLCYFPGFRSTYSHQTPSGNPLYGSESDDDESNLSSSPRSPLLANKRASISQSSDRPRRPSLPAHMHQSHSHSQNERYDAYRWLSNTGSEPGIDVRQDPGRYAELDDEVGVTVVDYATDGTASRVDLPGSKLETWLNSQDGKRPVSPAPQTPGLDEKKANDRPRKSVRWINLDGE